MSNKYARAPMFDNGVDCCGPGVDPGTGLELFILRSPTKCSAIDTDAGTALVVWTTPRTPFPSGWVELTLEEYRTEFEAAKGRQPSESEE